MSKEVAPPLREGLGESLGLGLSSREPGGRRINILIKRKDWALRGEGRKETGDKLGNGSLSQGGNLNTWFRHRVYTSDSHFFLSHSKQSSSSVGLS